MQMLLSPRHALVLRPRQDFVLGAVHRVLIASYEAARKHCEALAGAADLLVCDEGHRCGGGHRGDFKLFSNNNNLDGLLCW